MVLRPLLWTGAMVAAAAGMSQTGTERSAEMAPSIEGTYQLLYRELPDGTTLRAPEVIGLMTFTSDRRNVNVYWEEDGRPVSVSVVSEYRLEDSQYSEKNIYYMLNDGASEQSVNYDLSDESASSPVTNAEGLLAFQLPLHNEPHVAFNESGCTATREGEFIDHWQKID